MTTPNVGPLSLAVFKINEFHIIKYYLICNSLKNKIEGGELILKISLMIHFSRSVTKYKLVPLSSTNVEKDHN